ncbi:helix-turn-helix domain-containing protein [Burkholderia sp. Ac-20344]|uniref:winged helix-turn-helix domain-containing protein n=1 Tax=Burkholderia sp. Ac-20344 TaxID=2703890 RepID=UPI00197BFFCE|nr:helix-turn-helix domain-containing protein [Burkholderia sp. Ac-20344]MBN3836261.1 helix-turn-helix domain-containing protein [Burkholderia sp. Ac-20344]
MAKYLIEQRHIFDTHTMSIACDGAVTPLAANESELLGMLMNGGVTKQTVIEQIWERKGVYVTEGSYHQLVRALRVKLEAQGVDPSVVKTLPRLGLKFIGSILIVADGDNGSSIPVSDEVNVESIADSPTFVAPTLSKPAVPECAPSSELLRLNTNDVPAAKDDSPPDHSLRMPASNLEPDEAHALVRHAPVQRSKISARTGIRCALCLAIGVWTCVLAWKTLLLPDTRFHFQFHSTVAGIHYFSNGKMTQRSLLATVGVIPKPGNYVYQIGLGANNWIAVCPASIFKTPELCDSYLIEQSF